MVCNITLSSHTVLYELLCDLGTIYVRDLFSLHTYSHKKADGDRSLQLTCFHLTSQPLTLLVMKALDPSMGCP